MTRLISSLAIAWLCLAAPAQAQQPAPAQGDEIVVTGQRTEEAIRNFVGQIAVATRAENQLARWDRRICPGVAGLQTRYAQFVIDRMAQRALDIGLDVGEPGCRANILIVVSADPDAIARELRDNNPDKMGYLYERGRRTLGRRALEAFVTSDAPVRWWHVNRTVTRDGRALGETSTGGAPVERITGNASRLSRTTRQDFGAAFVIVDARQLKGVSFEALADYVTMVSLAQVDPETDTRAFPSLLNVFAARDAGGPIPAALTDWDMAYLRGLYGVTRDAASAARQEDEIARSMNRELTPK